MTNLKWTGLCVGFLLLVSGCIPFMQEEPGRVDIRGTITSLQPAGEGAEAVLGSVLIEGALAPDTSFDKASVTITDQTRLLDQTGGDFQSTEFDALAVGQTVAARFTGPVAESYPVQAIAEELIILSR